MLITNSVNSKSVELPYIRKLLCTAFPKIEQIPLWFLLLKSKNEFADFISYFDNDKFVAFSYTITFEKTTFILYLAVDNIFQSNGYGSKILDILNKKFDGNQIVLNIEKLDETANNNIQRIKRKNFYLKNGYKETGFELVDNKVVYEVLSTDSIINIQNCIDLLRKFAGKFLYIFCAPKFRNYRNY